MAGRRVFEEIFSYYELGVVEAAWGVVLAILVTTGLTVQAFFADDVDAVYFSNNLLSDAWSINDLRYTVFGVHCATLLFVIGDAVRNNGVKAFYAHFTIGSGTFATLAQVPLVALAANQTAFILSLSTLALQCYANALMLAIIIADLRKEAEYKPLNNNS
jgi:hypothetical protein